MAENGSNAQTHHRRDEMHINVMLQNTERAESRANSLRTISNKFGVAMEMAWKTNAENDFDALKKLHPVTGYPKLLDGIAIFNAWKAGGNARLDNVRANSKADDLLKVLDKTSSTEKFTGQEFAAYAKTFRDNCYPYFSRPFTETTAVVWLISKLPLSLRGDGRRLTEKFENAAKMDDWGHVLGALVLLIDETFDARKSVHEVGAVAHAKEIKVMQTTISKLMTAFSKTDAASKALKTIESAAPGAM